MQTQAETAFEIEVVEYGIDDNDHLYGVFQGGREVAGPFASFGEAKAAIAKATA